ncbi:MAG: hypothetical protein LBS96_00580 [Oscillospiraceae bacterium]|jgi:hypothetical protein|nr:hypothetical protein [Oscillospiraceae bacterium]
MKKRILALALCLSLLFAGASLPASAAPIPLEDTAAAAIAALPDSLTSALLGPGQAVAGLLGDTVQELTDLLTLPLATLFSLRGFFIALDLAVSRLVKVILTAIETLLPPARSREDVRSYTSEDFLPGHTSFLTAPAAGNRFSLGYASESILPADFGEKPYRMGGYDFNKFATETYDDLRVRTVVLDDGSGRGAVAFAVLDVIGLANADVRAIRAQLRDLTQSGQLAAINVSVTHTHSAIDSQGLWGNDLLQMIPRNILAAFFPSLLSPVQGIDPTFLETIVEQTEKSIRSAYANLEPGTLYFAKKNAAIYFSDKIDPFIYDENVYRLRFQPDAAASRPTVIASFGAHPERVGMITDDNPGNVVSADFVPYMENVVDGVGGFNFLYLQGAVGTRISANTGPSSDGIPLNRLEGTQRYGQEMGYFLLGMTQDEAACAALYAPQLAKDQALIDARDAKAEDYSPWYADWQSVDEEEVEPYLNVALQEVLVEVKNPILKAVGKLWLADNKMVFDHLSGKTYTLTEVGYLEVGGSLKALLQPGETSPELLLGGSNLTAEGSVTGKAFPLQPLRESVDENLIALDLMNDSIGYIIPDNDSTNLLLRYIDGQLTDTGSLGANLNDSLLLSFSTTVASTVLGAFLELVESVAG